MKPSVQALKNLYDFAKSKLDDPTRAEDSAIFKNALAAIEHLNAQQKPVGRVLDSITREGYVAGEPGDPVLEPNPHHLVTFLADRQLPAQTPLYIAPPNPVRLDDGEVKRVLHEVAAGIQELSVVARHWPLVAHAIMDAQERKSLEESERQPQPATLQGLPTSN